LTDSFPSFQKEIDLSFLKQIIKKSHWSLTNPIQLEYKANGCGIYSSIDYPNIKRKIMLASLGKAFGLTGGVIASDLFIKQIAENEVLCRAPE
jgi:hypothetical protein